jgi:tripartite-type tricarboxylate transporter receptor subunit TctC
MRASRAQDFPSRPIRVVIPYPPGGGTDALARPLAERLRLRLIQPIVQENRAAAATHIGMEHVARSAPDRHTLIINADSVALFPHLDRRLTERSRGLTRTGNRWPGSTSRAMPAALWTW